MWRVAPAGVPAPGRAGRVAPLSSLGRFLVKAGPLPSSPAPQPARSRMARKAEMDALMAGIGRHLELAEASSDPTRAGFIRG